MAPLTFFAKGDPQTGELQDCPFCHRVLLTLRAKEIPFDLQLVDLDKKPQWLLDSCQGKVPVIRVPMADEEQRGLGIELSQSDGASSDNVLLVPDSDKIVEFLETRFPNTRSLVSSVPADLTANVMPAFTKFLFASKEDEPAKLDALLAQLQPINDFIPADKGPLFGGLTLDSTDCAFAPKLYHILVACGHFKGWLLPVSMSSLWRYMGYIQTLPIWQKDDYGSERIIAGWRHHGAKETAKAPSAP